MITLLWLPSRRKATGPTPQEQTTIGRQSISQKLRLTVGKSPSISTSNFSSSIDDEALPSFLPEPNVRDGKLRIWEGDRTGFFKGVTFACYQILITLASEGDLPVDIFLLEDIHLEDQYRIFQ